MKVIGAPGPLAQSIKCARWAALALGLLAGCTREAPPPRLIELAVERGERGPVVRARLEGEAQLQLEVPQAGGPSDRNYV